MGALRCSSQHTYSGSIIETDAPLDNQGKAERFSPTDLVATALVNCMFTIMGIYARDRAITIEGMKAEMKKVMYTEPRRMGEIHIDVYFPSQGSLLSDKDKDALRRSAQSCPVLHSLHPEIKIHLQFHG